MEPLTGTVGVDAIQACGGDPEAAQGVEEKRNGEDEVGCVAFMLVV